MKTNEIENMKNLYKKPSIKVIELTGAGLFCNSNDGQTEGYDINGSYFYDDDDFE